MANLAEIADLTKQDVAGLQRYFNDVVKAHEGAPSAVQELMGLLPVPKVARPAFSANQEKTLLVQTGMWIQKMMGSEKH